MNRQPAAAQNLGITLLFRRGLSTILVVFLVFERLSPIAWHRISLHDFHAVPSCSICSDERSKAATKLSLN